MPTQTPPTKFSDIRGLRGKGDYREILVSWEYPTKSWFMIQYCEVQAWGPSRCKAKVVEAGVGLERNGSVQYSVVLSGLRMSTNYSISVEEGRRTRRVGRNRTILVATKGFSARAVSCLPDVSEVEVETGPYFQGRIGVESGPCSIDGDPNSPKDTYLLRIQHADCGSASNDTAVSTFVLVQESSHILTHSTRRFLVLCTFQPETLTVRAGLNLPHTADGMVEPSLSDMSENEVHAAPLMQDQQKEAGNKDMGTVFGTIGIVAGLVAVGLFMWKYLSPKLLTVDEGERREYDNLESSNAEAGESSTETVTAEQKETFNIKPKHEGTTIEEVSE
nr:uncharacterized protein LOC106677375 [Halyomorpha halys]